MKNTININAVYTNARGQKITERILDVEKLDNNTAKVCVVMTIREGIAFELSDFYATIPVLSI